MNRYLILLSLLFLPFSVFSQSDTGLHSLGETIRISSQNYPYVEPHAAVNPEDPSNIVVGTMSLPVKNKRIKIEVFYSLDGGNSWKASTLPDAPVDGGDPQISFGADGTVYLVILPATLFISTDNGQRFKKSFAIPRQNSASDTLTGSYDYPKVLGTPDGEHIFIAVRQSIRISDEDPYSTSSVNLIRYNASDSSFNGPVRNTLGYMGLQVGNPVLTGDKDLLFPVSEITKYGSRQIVDSPRLWIARSTDMGSTLEPLRFVRENHMASPPSMSSFTSEDSKEIVVASFANYEPKNFNLYSLLSEDGGMSWSSLHRINDDTSYTHTKRPETLFSDTGVLAHFWMDSRDDTTGTCFTPYFTYSKNYGKSYSENIPLFEKAICNDTPGNQIPYGNTQTPDFTMYDRWKRGGDYFGLISLPENTFMAIWSDSRNGTYQLYSRRVTIQEN